MQILPICGLSTCRQTAKVMREDKHRKRTLRAGWAYQLLGTVVLFFSVYIETLSGIEPKSFTTQARECLNYFQLTNKQSILLLFIE